MVFSLYKEWHIEVSFQLDGETNKYKMLRE